MQNALNEAVSKDIYSISSNFTTYYLCDLHSFSANMLIFYNLTKPFSCWDFKENNDITTLVYYEPAAVNIKYLQI